MEEIIQEKIPQKSKRYSKKNFKNFYRFINDNDLRLLVHLILSRLKDKDQDSQ